MYNPPIIAHRAGNSIQRLKKAIEHGADGIECDIHMTNDNEIVVYDTFYIKKNNSQVNIRELTYNNLRKLSTSENYKLKPTLLKEIISFVNYEDIFLIIDIKNGPVIYDTIHEKLVCLLKETKNPHLVYVMSYDHKLIRTIKEDTEFKCKAGILYSAKLINLRDTIKLTMSDFIETNNYYLTHDVIDEAHKANIELVGWSSSDFEEIKLNFLNQLDLITVNMDILDKSVKYRQNYMK